MNQMIRYFGNDIRRINHALKVYGFASAVCRSEMQSPETVSVIEMAALLHDIGIPVSEKKYNSCAGKYQELEGPPIAFEILTSLNIPPELVDRICFLIGHHHTYSKIDGPDFQILVEADFLVNIHEDNMNGKMIESIRTKYFRTRTGIDILDTLYINKIDLQKYSKPT
jgi:hypothetical protein